MQYRLAHHIFVHTKKMKPELIEEFGVQGARITVIPFRTRDSRRVRQSSGWASVRMKRRFCFSAESHLIKDLNT